MILDGHFILSPEFLIQIGVKSETIDFLIAQQKWGSDLLRDGDRLVEHMQRDSRLVDDITV